MKKQLFVFLVMATVIMGGSMVAAAQTYPNPTQQQTDEWRKKGPCRDPWVSMAVSQASAFTRYANGYGDYAECDPKWYNNGSWNSYDELYKAVDEAQRSWWQNGYQWKTAFLSGNKTAIYLIDRNDRNGVVGGVLLKGLAAGGSNTAVKLIGADGATLIGNDAASIVAAGGGNIVAAGGGNIVAAGGGNFSLMATGKKKIKIGKNTYMVIQ